MEQVRNEQTIYSAAVYCRLSKDDEQAGESVSIETQKMMLTDFCHERGFSIYEIYADDGYSGLNFNRPAFTRLLEDIDSGKINLVITKDLSRLGRDYIQTGYYTDVYFSRKRVRYIAVNDGIDTNRDDNDIAPFKNILNDMYAKDLSRKVKEDLKKIGYNPFNSDTSNVLSMNKVSFIDGIPVIKIGRGQRSGTFGAIFLADGEGKSTLNHEKGHSFQLTMMSLSTFLVTVAIPSSAVLGGYDGRSDLGQNAYYYAPWETMADILGNASHGQTEKYYMDALAYYILGHLIIPAFFWWGDNPK